MILGDLAQGLGALFVFSQGRLAQSSTTSSARGANAKRGGAHALPPPRQSAGPHGGAGRPPRHRERRGGPSAPDTSGEDGPLVGSRWRGTGPVIRTCGGKERRPTAGGRHRRRRGWMRGWGRGPPAGERTASPGGRTAHQGIPLPGCAAAPLSNPPPCPPPPSPPPGGTIGVRCRHSPHAGGHPPPQPAPPAALTAVHSEDTGRRERPHGYASPPPPPRATWPAAGGRCPPGVSASRARGTVDGWPAGGQPPGGRAPRGQGRRRRGGRRGEPRGGGCQCEVGRERGERGGTAAAPRAWWRSTSRGGWRGAGRDAQRKEKEPATRTRVHPPPMQS